MSATGFPISRSVYLDRVIGLWQGKFIGGTLGAPIEGLKCTHQFPEHLTLPPVHVENDDTDLQILWLHALQARGVRLTSRDLMEEWREHVRAPWNEYGVAAANWERGILPPESGKVSNWFWANGMGGPIRAEIWGVICPGLPQLAARYAGLDGALDHSGEAVEAEKFLSALVAATFLEADPIRLIRDHALPTVAGGSEFHRMVNALLDWTASTDETSLIRERILREFGHPDMTHVLQNVGFALLGLLRSQGDFSRSIAIALNCGYDADCTAGIAGAILGAVAGFRRLSQESLARTMTDRYVVSPVMAGFPREGSIAALSQSCLAIARAVAHEYGSGFELPRDPGETDEPLLSIQPQTVVPLRPLNRVFPVWAMVGPYWRNWDERREQDHSRAEHGIATLPSAQYFSHLQSGFDRQWLDPKTFEQGGFPPPAEAQTQLLQAQDNRLPFSELAGRSGPVCYYAATWMRFTDQDLRWLMIGTTGPVEAWWNGEPVLLSQSHQSLTPNTFALEVAPKKGINSLILKLARSAEELEACVDVKHHGDLHWHQTFYDTAVEWLEPVSQQPIGGLAALAKDSPELAAI